MKTAKILGIGALAVAGLVIAGSLVPLNRTNPPVTAQVAWDSPQTKALFDRACADCHSNETKWPAYSYVAPANFLVYNHVVDGRRHFNVSVPLKDARHMAQEAENLIRSGIMPESSYLILHPEAKLTDAEKQQLTNGLKASLK